MISEILYSPIEGVFKGSIKSPTFKPKENVIIEKLGEIGKIGEIGTENYYKSLHKIFVTVYSIHDLIQNVYLHSHLYRTQDPLSC